MDGPSVLLRGINSSATVLSQPFQELYECGTIPFYLHHPDWTPDTFHFRTSIESGQKIYAQLRGCLPGAALPHYVLNIPQGFGKISIMDLSFKKLADFPSDLGSEELVNEINPRPKIRGALYELSPPQTRHGDPSKPLRYLDLFPS